MSYVSIVSIDRGKGMMIRVVLCSVREGRQAGRQTGRQAGRQTDRQTGRQAGRQ